MDPYVYRFRVIGLDFLNLQENLERNTIVEIHDSTAVYKEQTTDALRTSYKNIEEELIYRRDEVFYEIKEDLQRIIEMIHNKGYKLQVIDYDNEKRKIEIHNVMQFDVYDPVIENSEF